MFNIPHILCKIYSTNIFTYIVYITSTVDIVHVAYTIYILSKSTYTTYIYIYMFNIYIYICQIVLLYIYIAYILFISYILCIYIYTYTTHTLYITYSISILIIDTYGLAGCWENPPPLPQGGGNHLAGGEGGCGGPCSYIHTIYSSYPKRQDTLKSGFSLGGTGSLTHGRPPPRQSQRHATHLASCAAAPQSWHRWPGSVGTWTFHDLPMRSHGESWAPHSWITFNFFPIFFAIFFGCPCLF